MSHQHHIQIIAGVTLAFLIPIHAHATNVTSQDLATVEQVAIDFAKRASVPGSEITAQPLDRRLKLSQCSQRLSAFPLGRASRSSRRQTVGVRCTGTIPWKVYVSLVRETFITVPVATKYLAAGHVLTRQDLRLERRAESRLGSFVSHDLANLTGKKLRRAVHADQTIPTNTLIVEKLIKRGQHIDIIADLPGIRVRVAGIADSDGVANQRIWVKNLTSGQKIQAKVISENAVLASSL